MSLEIQISSSLLLTSANKRRTFFTNRVLFGVFFFFQNHAWKFWVRLIQERSLYTSLYGTRRQIYFGEYFHCPAYFTDLIMHNYQSNQSALMTRYGQIFVISMEFSAVNRRRPSRKTPLGPGAKKDGCFHRVTFVMLTKIISGFLFSINFRD